nr:MAG TPA: Get5 carboxyl domain [Bacteriophage sp.]
MYSDILKTNCVNCWDDLRDYILQRSNEISTSVNV